MQGLAFRSSFLPAGSARLSRSNGVRPARAGVRMVVEARTREAGVGIFGTKAGMMSYFTDEGLCLAATVIVLEGDNYVTQIKTEDTHGYNAVQVGYKEVVARKITKPELGHLAKAGAPPLKHLREFKLKDKAKVESYELGQPLLAEKVFKAGDLVDIAGISVGKGFAGSIKRWGMKRGLMTHGSKSHRQHGSIGAGTTPGRVYPGMHMAGHMGNSRVKVKKLKILKVDIARRAIVVRGTVPGKAGNVLEVAPTKIPRVTVF